jgi:hypothetical protein
MCSDQSAARQACANAQVTRHSPGHNHPAALTSPATVQWPFADAAQRCAEASAPPCCSKLPTDSNRRTRAREDAAGLFVVVDVAAPELGKRAMLGERAMLCISMQTARPARTRAREDVADLFVVVDVLLEERLDLGLIARKLLGGHLDDVLVRVAPHLRAQGAVNRANMRRRCSGTRSAAAARTRSGELGSRAGGARREARAAHLCARIRTGLSGMLRRMHVRERCATADCHCRRAPCEWLLASGQPRSCPRRATTTRRRARGSSRSTRARWAPACAAAAGPRLSRPCTSTAAAPLPRAAAAQAVRGSGRMCACACSARR